MMDQNLKNRLTGAVILVSRAVIFSPVILEGPDNDWTPKSQGIPEPPKLDYRARTELPKAVETPALVKHDRKVEEKPAHTLSVPDRQESIALAPEPAVTSEPEEAPEPDVTPEPDVAAAPDVNPDAPQAGAMSGWYVQVGSFSQEQNANRLGKRLKLSGYDNYVLKKTTAKGIAWSIIVGIVSALGIIVTGPSISQQFFRTEGLHGLDSPAIISFTLALLTLVVVSLLTQKDNKTKLA